MKKQGIWIMAILVLWILVNVVSDILGWGLREGFSGIVIQLFFGYCALILVAQAFSALAVIRKTLAEAARQKRAAPHDLVREEISD